MRAFRIALIALLIASLALPLSAGSPNGYMFPRHPVMMHLSVASNGSFAVVGITISEYGRIPGYMCPIDSPGTYIGCRELSRREFLILELGNGVKYVNLTGSLAGFNFTSFSVVPIGERWFLIGVKKGHPCEFGICANVSYTVMEYFPGGKLGKPVSVPRDEAWVLFHLPEAMAAGGKASDDSLVFSFSYAGENYSVPAEAFRDYLELLNFTDSSGLTNESLLKLFRAVPFRDGVLLYLPGYGLEPYAPEPHSLREYLLVRNELNAYSPFLWAGHKGFVCVPGNGTSKPMTDGIFPPLFYYHGGRLLPVMNISVETFNRTLKDGERFRCSWPVLGTPNESRAEFGGNSSPPEFKLPKVEGVYTSLIKPMPHYSPNNLTLIDLCLNSGSCLHAEFDGGSLIYLRTPFSGLFFRLNGRWLYHSMNAGDCHEFCIYGRTPRYNRTFLYDPAKKMLIPLDSWSPGSFREKTAPQHPGGENVWRPSKCIPTPESSKMLKKVRVGDGVMFYYPVYAPRISLKGRETVLLGGPSGLAVFAELNGTCVLFYRAGEGTTFALRPDVMPVSVPVGNWTVELGVPYLDTANSLGVSVEIPENTTSSGTTGTTGPGICGPALLVGLSVVAALIRRNR